MKPSTRQSAPSKNTENAAKKSLFSGKKPTPIPLSRLTHPDAFTISTLQTDEYKSSLDRLWLRYSKRVCVITSEWESALDKGVLLANMVGEFATLYRLQLAARIRRNRSKKKELVFNQAQLQETCSKVLLLCALAVTEKYKRYDEVPAYGLLCNDNLILVWDQYVFLDLASKFAKKTSLVIRSKPTDSKGCLVASVSNAKAIALGLLTSNNISVKETMQKSLTICEDRDYLSLFY